MSFGMVVFGAGGGSDESSGDEEEGGSQGSAVDIEDMGRCVHAAHCSLALLAHRGLVFSVCAVFPLHAWFVFAASSRKTRPLPVLMPPPAKW
jgi:hypothetical protein